MKEQISPIDKPVYNVDHFLSFLRYVEYAIKHEHEYPFDKHFAFFKWSIMVRCAGTHDLFNCPSEISELIYRLPDEELIKSASFGKDLSREEIIQRMSDAADTIVESYCSRLKEKPETTNLC